jgi:hypothetical protein
VKIRPAVQLFHMDRQTDMIKLIVAFRYFVNAAEILRMDTLYVVFMYMCMFKLIHEFDVVLTVHRR